MPPSTAGRRALAREAGQAQKVNAGAAGVKTFERFRISCSGVACRRRCLRRHANVQRPPPWRHPMPRQQRPGHATRPWTAAAYFSALAGAAGFVPSTIFIAWTIFSRSFISASVAAE